MSMRAIRYTERAALRERSAGAGRPPELHQFGATAPRWCNPRTRGTARRCREAPKNNQLVDGSSLARVASELLLGSSIAPTKPSWGGLPAPNAGGHRGVAEDPSSGQRVWPSERGRSPNPASGPGTSCTVICTEDRDPLSSTTTTSTSTPLAFFSTSPSHANSFPASHGVPFVVPFIAILLTGGRRSTAATRRGTPPLAEVDCKDGRSFYNPPGDGSRALRTEPKIPRTRPGERSRGRRDR